jgi:hypothetical protein
VDSRAGHGAARRFALASPCSATPSLTWTHALPARRRGVGGDYGAHQPLHDRAPAAGAAEAVALHHIECLDAKSGATYSVTADTVVLAAGALGTPHLLLSSGLEQVSPAGDVVGRYLTRHCAGIVFGALGFS